MQPRTVKYLKREKNTRIYQMLYGNKKEPRDFAWFIRSIEAASVAAQAFRDALYATSLSRYPKGGIETGEPRQYNVSD